MAPTGEHVRRVQPGLTWRERGVLPADEGCGVYFVLCESFVKIGYATRVHRRLQTAQMFVPFELQLLHFEPCESLALARAVEIQFHQRFRAQHERGEWFRYEGPLIDFIMTARSANG